MHAVNGTHALVLDRQRSFKFHAKKTLQLFRLSRPVLGVALASLVSSASYKGSGVPLRSRRGVQVVVGGAAVQRMV
jgi:hypothetical protein